MKVRLFISNSINIGLQVKLDEDKSHYLKSVLRLQTGDKIFIFNQDDGEFEAVLLLEKNFSLVNPVKLVKNKYIKAGIKINLVFANIKNNLVADVLNSCTQVGVDEFFPIITKHTTNPHFSLERAKKIAEEATEQCGRMNLPNIHPICTFKEFLNRIPLNSFLLFCDEKADFDFNQIANINAKEVYIFVGPEGGFCEEEREALIKIGANKISLGKFILRAETASLCASFLTLFLART
jgi:16S rRNA (uracil1498-N3)-methyltransferase